MSLEAKQMIVQHGISVPVGGVPVVGFPIETRLWDVAESIATAVNFLRCGCPLVQMQGKGEASFWEQCRELIRGQINGLRLPDEKLMVAWDDMRHIITVRREQVDLTG